MNNNDIRQLSVKEFLSEDNYVIPIYQRNYDWGEKEVLQLIEDVSDYAKANSMRNYYIGSAVVFPRYSNGNEYFETIDGQQRLTTLTILVSLLRSLRYADWYSTPNLSYDYRKEADDALRMLNEKRFSEHPAARNIIDVYSLLEKNLLRILSEKKLSIKDFSNYLFDKVIIVRIPVPQDTELNHYFEIMNTRGEQLEKHEVLKAVLMSHLDRSEHVLYNQIWEACSDMSSYVQMNFNVNLRNIIFDDRWAKITYRDFDSLKNEVAFMKEELGTYDQDECNTRGLSDLFKDANNNIRYELPRDGSVNEGKQDRFGSIINFPNFLLHVLKVMCQNDAEFRNTFAEKIKLDDKRLITTFQDIVLKLIDDKRVFVKRFIMDLLYIRLQYDRYVIKREYINGNESWSLKNIKRYDEKRVNYVGAFISGEYEDDLSKDIRMLEAMFHVSAPTQIYKHWLNAILNYTYLNADVDPAEFRSKLYTLACTYMLDNYLADSKIDFEDIIYKNSFRAQNYDIHWNMIDQGCGVPNFVFNFYDYLTWRLNPIKYSKFEFTYRTSVEHFYPQTPMPGYENLEGKGLDDFGNLCLISRGMNSKFSNNMPKAKLDNFGLVEEVRNGLSLKLLEMMDVVRQKSDWGKEEIADFENSARARIYQALQDINGNQIKVI